MLEQRLDRREQQPMAHEAESPPDRTAEPWQAVREVESPRDLTA